MNRNLLIVALVGLISSNLTSPTFAQSGRELNWAEKMLSDLKVDFGTVARGAETRHVIEVTNLYEEDVHIVNVGTTCGCTAAKPNKSLLKTRDVAEIDVEMDTVKFMHRKDSNVDITLEFRGAKGTAQKTVRVPITAYIRSDVVLTPGNADFGAVDYQLGAERKVKVAYAGRSDWAIKDVKVDDENLKVELNEIVRTAGRVEYELTIQLDKTAPLGDFQDRILLVTDDKSSPEVPLLVSGRVSPDIEIVPSHFDLGSLTPGQTKPFNVVVKGRRPFVIESIECDGHPDCFEIKPVTDTPKTVHVVPFRVKVPDEPGNFAETFTVNVAGRELPLTFEADGVIQSGS
ncbi:DUF1573 domain-containing protein [Thalassoglobus sp. JC818]|uniref:DUF1573 domain-containing protein n=1 Tax=Thalassoglobus sp. JC818 TaxID=3232136 RepID=UPI00345A3889